MRINITTDEGEVIEIINVSTSAVEMNSPGGDGEHKDLFWAIIDEDVKATLQTGVAMARRKGQ